MPLEQYEKFNTKAKIAQAGVVYDAKITETAINQGVFLSNRDRAMRTEMEFYKRKRSSVHNDYQSNKMNEQSPRVKLQLINGRPTAYDSNARSRYNAFRTSQSHRKRNVNYSIGSV